MVVQISDTHVDSALRKKYPGGETHTLQDVSGQSAYKIRISSAGSDHIYCIYIGSDTPFSVETLSKGLPLDCVIGGSITIALSS